MTRRSCVRSLRGFARVGRVAAARLAILRHAKLFEPHPAHRRPQRRRAARALHRHHLSVAVPRRADRRAHPEPAGAGPDHRRRHRDSATVETDSSITLDPDKLQNLQPGESYGPSEDALYGIDFPINPERVAPILRRLVSPTKTRARIYDRDGVLLVDSRDLFGRGDVLRFDLPSPTAEKPGFFERAFIAVRIWLGRGDLPLYRELGPDDGKGYPEVAQALNGQDASMVRINDRGDVIVSVAVPVQRFRAVRGALMLSTQGADIDNMVEAERLAILKVFLVAAAVMIVLSILLAGTIAEPVRRLADAAESVRRRIRSRVEIPDFTRRRDEIGHLSGTLRDMTNALYSRIEGDRKLRGRCRA